MRAPIQVVLRRLTLVTRPLALRSAGKPGSNTAVVRHVGRTSGRTYDTPVVAVEHDGSLVVALPYAERTDWARNVLAKGHASFTVDGRTFEVERPELIPMAEVTGFFRPKEQRLHRRFHVESALRVWRC